MLRDIRVLSALARWPTEAAAKWNRGRWRSPNVLSSGVAVEVDTGNSRAGTSPVGQVVISGVRMVDSSRTGLQLIERASENVPQDNQGASRPGVLTEEPSCDGSDEQWRCCHRQGAVLRRHRLTLVRKRRKRPAGRGPRARRKLRGALRRHLVGSRRSHCD